MASRAEMIIASTLESINRHLGVAHNSSEESRRNRIAKRHARYVTYRDRERAKNRASMKAMGLSSNVADWPVKHQPEWARKKFPK